MQWKQRRAAEPDCEHSLNIARILRAARLVSWTYRLLSTVVGFVTVRLIIEGIGPSGYGEVAIALGILVGIAGIDLGITQALPRFVALFDAPEQRARRGLFWASIATVTLAIVFAQSMLISGVIVFLDRLDDLRILDPSELLAMGITLVVGTALSISGSIFAGFQMYGLNGLGKIIRSAIYLLAIVYLWRQDAISVRSALWANVLCTLAANAVMCTALLLNVGRRLTSTWVGFPTAHGALIQDIAQYSLRGWLFSFSTILLSSGSVVLAGYLETPTHAAALQIAMLLFTGITAFITGAMTPLSTIIARSSDGSATSQRRVADTASSLVAETVVISSAVMVGVIHFGQTIVGLLVGAGEESMALVSTTYTLSVIVAVLGVGVMPLYVYRFALVGNQDNAGYSRAVLLYTATALLAGGLASAYFDELIYIAIGAGVALAYRGVKAFRMGWKILPSVRVTAIILAEAKWIVVFELLALLIVFPGAMANWSGLSQALLFAGISSMVYLFRARIFRFTSV